MKILKNSTLLSSLVLLISVNAYAEKVYKNERMDLKSTLDYISKTSTLPYLVNGELIVGKKSPKLDAIKGVNKALEVALKNTNLEASIDGDIITIKRKNEDKKSIKLNEVNITSSEELNNNSSLNLYDVSNTASRLEATIKEIPSSIEIINSNIMKLRGDNTLIEAVGKTAGMTGSKDPGAPGVFSVRGFDSRNITILYNGIKIPGGSNMSIRPMDTANFEKVEIIRGPASVLNGEGSIGAAINVITKKPTFEEQDSELNYSIGSYDAHRFHFGSGGTLVKDTLAYRFDYSKNSYKSNIEKEKTELDAVALSLLYKIQDNLSATLEIEKTKDDSKNIYHGTPLINNKLSKSIRNENYNQLKDGVHSSDNLWLRSNIDWQINNNLKISNQMYLYDSYRDWTTIAHFKHNSTTNQIDRKWFTDLDHDHKVIGNRINLLSENNIAGFENKLLVGFDITKTDFETAKNGYPGNDSVSLKNPESKYFSDVATAYKYPARKTEIVEWAFYLEDQFNITNKLKLVAGLRYDNIKPEWTDYNKNYGGVKAIKSKKHNFSTYRIGALYDFDEDTTAYATYSTAKETGGTLLLLNHKQTDLDLTDARQFEIGVKQSFWDEKAFFTGAVYDIEKKNIFVSDPNSPSDKIPAGKQSSRGIELSLLVKPTDKWQIDANFAKVDAKYDDYSIFNKGTNELISYDDNKPKYAPEIVANLGLRYKPTPKLGISTWVKYVDSVFVDDANSIKLPSYTTLDLGIDYKLTNRINLAFNIKNLTDEFYATRTRFGTSAIIGKPRTYNASLSFKF